MFFVTSGKRREKCSTTEALPPVIRRLMMGDTVMLWVLVGREEAVMPYATFMKRNGQWHAGVTGDCIRCGFAQNEFPEDPDPVMVALDRGDTVVMQDGVEVLDTERVGDINDQARTIARAILEGAHDG